MSTPAQDAVVLSPAPARRKSRLSVDLADPTFADAVVADVNRIRRSVAGRALFRELAAAGCTVQVVKPNPPMDPPNAWTLHPGPNGGTEPTVMVVYDPADWPGPRELGGLPSDVVLFGRLQHALRITTGTLIEADEAVPQAMAAYLRQRTKPPEPAMDRTA